MKSSDVLIQEFGDVRALRTRLKAERDGLFCIRAEPVTRADFEDAAAEHQSDPLAAFEFPQPTQSEPCWKAARKWRDTGYRSEFYFDPPQSEWCESCRRRQAASDAYREAVRRHGGALRGLLRRAATLRAAAKDSAALSQESQPEDGRVETRNNLSPVSRPLVQEKDS